MPQGDGMENASSIWLTIVTSLTTGSLIAITASLLRFHTRFIRMEETVKTLRRDVKSMQRMLVRRLPRITFIDPEVSQSENAESEQW